MESSDLICCCGSFLILGSSIFNKLAILDGNYNLIDHKMCQCFETGISNWINQQIYFALMRQAMQRQESIRRRIKTQEVSDKSSSTNILSTESMANRPRQFCRFPTLPIYQIHQNKRSLNRINEQETSAQHTKLKRASVDVPYNKKIEIARTQKIFESLCKQPDGNTNSMLINSTSLRAQPYQMEKYENVRLAYEDMKSAKKTKDVQELLNLIKLLKEINKMFQKIDDILTLILLKKGKVLEFDQKQLIYSQNEPQSSTLILLWGEVKLKEIYRGKVKYCIPGDMLCEEILTVDSKKNRFFSEIDFVKGNLITKQTAKAQSKCGFLVLTRDSYEQIKQRFCENGQKDKIFVLQKIIASSLSKKSKLRR